jgi:hypothetical protein
LLNAGINAQVVISHFLRLNNLAVNLKQLGKEKKFNLIHNTDTIKHIT